MLASPIMPQPRNVRNPLVKTYIKPARPKSGMGVSVRIYAPQFDLDKKGSGRTVESAIKRALKGVPKAQRKTR